MLERAKRNKAFDGSRFIGLAVDGTTVGRRRKPSCPLCRGSRNAAGEVVGYRHHVVMAAVVGTGLTLPVDVEPYASGESEYAAVQRLLQRVHGHLGARFAAYVVADGEDRVETWDADDFDPWEGLRWETVRVIRYRQHKPNGDVVEAFWLADFASRALSRRSLYLMAKSRWEIENQGFNDAKSRYGFEPICRHHPHRLLIVWLLTCLVLTVERLYRLRYLHRGCHAPRTATELVRLLQRSFSPPAFADSS